MSVAAAGLTTGQAIAATPAVTNGPGGSSTTASGLDSPRANASEELPLFRSTGEIVDPLDDSLPWNPNHEFIFPSIFHAGEHLDDPLAEWYIYFAPHDAPGGINLMYSDSLDGPWTQYEGNPLISNHWDGVYDVSHVSSPDAVWSAKDDEMFLFFHGENTVTRYATSSDGIHFDYGDEAVDNAGVDAAQTDFENGDGQSSAPGRAFAGASYARVFRHPDPSTGYRWAMFFMTNYADNVRRINVAYSPDLRHWDIAARPIVEPGDAEGTNVSAGDLFRWRGRYYVIYHGTTGSILARPVDKELTTSGAPEKLFVPQAAPPEAGRAAAPQIIRGEDGRVHMFYEYGERSHTTIGHAIEDPTAVRDPLNQNPDDPTYATCPGTGSDAFDGASLDTNLWSQSVRLDGSGVQVADGALHMPTAPGNSTTAPEVLQPVPDGPFEVTTKLTLHPEQNYQQAGLIVRRDDGNSVRAMLGKSSQGPRIDFIWRHGGVDRINHVTSEDFVYAPDDLGGTIWLRITSNGDYLTASYSADGQEFLNLGRAVAVDDLQPNDVGAVAYRGPDSTPEIDAAFDWVRFTPTADEMTACG